jgi:hypothetical protein
VAEQIAMEIWLWLAAYASLGALLWLALMLGLMKRLDAAAAAASWRVKAVLSAGLIALWPIVLALLIRPRERRS